MNKLAVALSEPDTRRTLAELTRLANIVGFAEVRLDLMESFDLSRLIDESPLPLVITYRPVREGGTYDGDEFSRLETLRTAGELDAAYLDIEVDCLDIAREWDVPSRLIASHHDFETMPTNFVELYRSLRDRCDVVKLVGTAKSVDDCLPVFELLQSADTPVITMAMGEHGVSTRLLAPLFESCLLTYGAASAQKATAPGQISVKEMSSLGVQSWGEDVRLELGDHWRIERRGSFTSVIVPDASTLSILSESTLSDREE